MALSVDSKTFRDALQEMRTGEDIQNVLTKYEIDKDEFKNTLEEYRGMSEEERKAPAEITGLPIVDPILRIGGRAFGEAGRGTAEFAEDIAPVTTEKISNIFSNVSDKFGDYVPDSVKDFADEIFDPYHGDGIYGSGEEMVGKIGSYFVPATGIVKVGRGVTNVAKGNKAVRAGLEKVSNRIKRGTKVAGYGVAGAGSATIIEDPNENIVNILREQFPESTTLLDNIAVDPNDTASQQRLQAFINNLGLEASVVGGFVGLGKAWKGTKGFREKISETKLGAIANYIKGATTSRAGLDDDVLVENLKRKSAPTNALQDANALGLEMKKLISGFSKDEVETVNKALEGDFNAINTLNIDVNKKEQLLNLTKEMRDNIDNLSKFFLEKSNIGGKKNIRATESLTAKIRDNLETYVTRTYDFYDDPVYKDKILKLIRKEMPNIKQGNIQAIKKTDETLANAVEFIGSRTGYDNNRIAASFEDILRKSDNEEDFAKAIQDYSSFYTTAKGTKKRKELFNQSEALRILFGEVRDPAKRYQKSIAKLAQQKAEVEFLESIANDIISKKAGEFGTKSKGIKDIVDVPPDKKSLKDLTEVANNRLAKVFGKAAVSEKGVPIGDNIVSVASTIKNPLQGLYANANYKRILDEGLNELNNFGPKSTFLGKIAQAAGKAWIGLKVGSQYSATVANPLTHARNVLGNMVFMVSNGMLPGVKGTFEAGKYTIRKLAGFNNRKVAEQFNKYRELGITSSDVGIGTIKRNLAEFNSNPEKFFNRRLSVKEAIKYPFRKLADIYQIEDDIFKIMHFENTKGILKKAYPDLAEDALNQMAAKRTRDLMPNYNLAPRALRALRLAPVGDFATFASESVRVAKNLFKYTLEDAISGNAALTASAAKRLAGMTAAGLGADMLAEKSRILMGIDDEQEKNIQNIRPPYEFMAPQVYLSNIYKRNGKNVIDSVSLLGLDPFDYPKSFVRALHAVANDDNFTTQELSNYLNDGRVNNTTNKIATSIFDKTLAPFLGTSIGTDAALDFLTGARTIGRDEELGAGSIALNFFENSLMPGGFKFFLKRQEYEEKLKNKDKELINKGYPGYALYSTRTQGIPGEVDIDSLLGFKINRLDIDSTVPFNVGYDLTNVVSGRNKKFKNILKGRRTGKDDLATIFGGKGGTPITKKEILQNLLTDEKRKIFVEKDLRYMLKTYLDLGLSLEDIIKDLKVNTSSPLGKEKIIMLRNIIDNKHTPDSFTQTDRNNFEKFLRPQGIDLPEAEIINFRDRLRNNKIDEED